MILPRVKNTCFLLTTFCLLIYPKINKAQVSIKGPTCVTTSVSYQYEIKGPWIDNTSFKICVSGGAIVGGNSSCYSGKPVSFIRINWDPQSINGSLTLNSSCGDTTFNVAITAEINGGSIDTQFVFQNIPTGKIPSTITSSGASGGNCNPKYSYQWQWSYDMIDWTDITGANNQSLGFSTPATKIIYYRRKVTETSSKAVGYSTIATVANN